MQKTELLAPAGSYETMTAAYNAGADAVYIGGRAFGARAYADNPDEKLLLQAIRYAHLHGKKLYLTVNTLVKEDELWGNMYDYLRPYYEEGLDAVIVQDMGVLRFLREFFPKLPVHASTQMTITGRYSAKKLEELGVSRVVTARELSLKEIRSIHDSCGLEIESFVHGALCYCYSGQCLFSSLAGGRSGNRGRCAQPCRMPYQLFCEKKPLTPKEAYLLSPKDLNTIERLPELIEAGVYSLKIEGRMKKPEYTAGVVSIYRKYLDQYLEKGKEGYHVSKEDQKALFDLFNRKGFTGGYYFRQNGKQMITLEKPSLRPENEALNQTIRDRYLNGKLKENIKGKVRIFAGEPVIIEAACRGYTGSLKGEAAMKAKSRPLTEADIIRCMEKLGDTDFSWEELAAETDGASFYPVGKLNELRRGILERLEEAVCGSFHRKSGRAPQDAEQSVLRKQADCDVLWYAGVQSREQLFAVLQKKWISRIYLDSHIAQGEELVKLASRVRQAGRECWLALPYIVRERAEEQMDKELSLWARCGFDGYLVSCAEGLCFLKKKFPDAKVTGDHTLYAWTKEAEAEWREWGLCGLTAPVELNGKELQKRGLVGTELIVYGYLPMMVTAQCLHQSSAGCIGKQEDLLLKDRLGNLFPVRNFCRECYNIIYNNRPLSLAEVLRQALACGPSAARLSFTVEDKEQTELTLDYFEKILRAASGKRTDGKEEPPFALTKGHWKRGVE